MLVAAGDVPRVVDAVAEGLGGLLRIPVVPLEQAHGAGVQPHADLSLPLAVHAVAGLRVAQLDVEAGQWAAHCADHHALVWGVGDLQGGLGLAEAVADGHAPAPLHLVDHGGVERLSPAEAALRGGACSWVRSALLSMRHMVGGRRRRGRHAGAGGFVTLATSRRSPLPDSNR